MEPLEPAPGTGLETRRPRLMDPAGARQSGFAPPATLPESGQGPAPVAGAQAVPPTPTPRTGPTLGSTPTPRSGTQSVLAHRTPNGPAAGGAAGAASFGPVSQVVRVSVRTLSSRIDLVLPDRSTVTETLETVLELAPRSLREQAIAHGGWILRTAAGEAIPGSTTLLDQGIVDGSTLFLTGIDAAGAAAVYDDVADAVADTVREDPSAWPSDGDRAVALGAAGLFAGLACLSLLWAGPPWTAVAVTLGGIAVLGQLAAGLVRRRIGDDGIALVIGLLSVVAGAAAATVATAGSSPLLEIGAPKLLLGAAAGALFATTAALAIGTRRVPFTAIVTGSLLLCIGLGCGVVFDLRPAGAASIVVGLALCLMPVVPSVSLRLAGFELNPLPPAADDIDAAHETVDAPAVRNRTRQAVGYLTALIQGLAWPTVVAGAVLAFSHDTTAQVLAGIVGAGLILRARLFITIGQRLPLLIAGIGSVVALLVASMMRIDGPTSLIVVAAPALLAVVGCLLLAAQDRRLSPALTRAAEIIDLLIAIAVVPLVAGVLGVFAFIRGLGG